MGRAAILTVLLALSGPAAAGDDDTVEMVEAFLKLPTAELPPEHIPRFLAVDPAELPEKDRQPFLARRLELNTLRRLAEGRKKGLVRMPAEDCSIPKDDEGLLAKFIGIAGFQEITEDEKRLAEEQTHCTQRDLMCEFSLLVIREPTGDKKKKRRRFFLHFRDPVYAIVEKSRDRDASKQTNFFGAGASPVCSH